MIKSSLLEFFIKGFLESFSIILAVHAICSIKIEIKKYIISTIILNICTFIIRELPINFGVHTVFNLLCLIGIFTFIYKINMYNATKSCLGVTLGLFFIEAINVLILQATYGNRFVEVIKDPVCKLITSIPSAVLFGVIAFIWYKVSMNKLKLRGYYGSYSK